MTDERLRELGAFLRDRRMRMEPAAVGIPATGVRKTAGLRREELSDLAGVSIGYYVRLEQGRGGPPSASVIDALARALRLTEDERAYLHLLADPPDSRYPTTPTPEMIRKAHDVLELVTPPFPAYVIDAVSDVLAWNSRAEALFVGHLRPGTRPNNVRYVFRNPAARALFTNWTEIADDTVAHLRASAGHRPEYPAVRALVAELSSASKEFADRWESRTVRPRTVGAKEFAHPNAGPMRLTHWVLDIPETCHHRLVVYRAEPGSRDFEALQRLESGK